MTGYVVALIVACLLAFVATITAYAQHYRHRSCGEVLDMAVELQRAAARVQIEDLTHERDILNDYARSQQQRADKMLSQLYDLRRELGLAIRAHTDCVDRWADGGTPCAQCLPLLPERANG